MLNLPLYENCISCTHNANTAEEYEISSLITKKNLLTLELIEAWTGGDCLLSIVFDKGVLGYVVTEEIHAMHRKISINDARDTANLLLKPLFEVKNSQRLEVYGIRTSHFFETIRHFFILTDSVFVDVFSYYPPRIIVKNKANCEGKEHRNGYSNPEIDNGEFLIA